MLILQNLDDLESAACALCAIYPRFKDILSRHGLPSLRTSPQGLEGLLIIITEQFLSLQAAATIWARLKSRLGDCNPNVVSACPQSELMALGLSGTKAKAFHAAAHSNLNFQNCDAETVTKRLLSIHGVGPWTADIYLLSVMAAADAWPKGDLALRIAIQDFLGLQNRPKIAEMDQLAAEWRPYRAVAARLLWSHYRGLKGLHQA